jgi:hypothetical protein
VASLTSTPPRPSYADKVKGVFNTPTSTRAQYLMGPSPASDTSALTTESELEKRIKATSKDEGAEDSGVEDADQDSGIDEAKPAKPPPPATEIIQTLLDESSTDEWTGDDEFFPPHARRRHALLEEYKREQERERQQQKAKSNDPPPPSWCQARTMEMFRETRALLGMKPVSPPKHLRDAPLPREMDDPKCWFMKKYFADLVLTEDV